MLTGQTIGKYQIKARVGRGGMGTVYLAFDETLGREVAIKVLNQDLNDPDVVRRFRAEAMTVARFSHPAITTVYEMFQHDGQWLMVMEFVRGENLDHVIERFGPMAPERAGALMVEVLNALAYAHRMNVVHRDLKPANLMLTEQGAIKVMDFGIARVMGSEHLTHAGFTMGTPAYMAPEQVLGQDVDERADLYAVGVVLYRLTTGRLPFTGTTPFSIAQSQVNDPPTPAHFARAGLPAWVSPLLDRALAKAPNDRFQSAEEFRAALESGVAGTPALSAPSAETMLSPASGAPSATVPLSPTPRRPVPAPPVPVEAALPIPVGDTGTVVRPKRHLATGAIAVILIAAVAVGAYVFRDQLFAPAPPPTSAPTSSSAAPPVVTAPPPAPAGARSSTPPVSQTPTPPVKGRAADEKTTGSKQVGRSDPPPAPAGPPASKPNPPPPSVTPPPAASPVVPIVAASPPKTEKAEPQPGEPPLGPRGRPGGRGVAGGPPPGVGRGEAPMVFNDVRFLVVVDGKGRLRNAVLRFGGGRVTVVSRPDNAMLLNVPYRPIVRATYVFATKPKWDSGFPAPPPGVEMPGLREPPPVHWLTLQTPMEHLVFILTERNYNRVLETVKSHIGIVVARPPS